MAKLMIESNRSFGVDTKVWR